MENKRTSGQMGLASLLSVAGAVLVAIIGGYFGQASRTDAKLEETKKEQRIAQLEIAQRVTASETKVDNIQTDLKEVKQDVKELLRRLK